MSILDTPLRLTTPFQGFSFLAGIGSEHNHPAIYAHGCANGDRAITVVARGIRRQFKLDELDAALALWRAALQENGYRLSDAPPTHFCEMCGAHGRHLVNSYRQCEACGSEFVAKLRTPEEAKAFRASGGRASYMGSGQPHVTITGVGEHKLDPPIRLKDGESLRLEIKPTGGDPLSFVKLIETKQAYCHYGSNGSAECGADYPDMALTKVKADVTCATCRGWLPIVDDCASRTNLNEAFTELREIAGPESFRGEDYPSDPLPEPERKPPPKLRCPQCYSRKCQLITPLTIPPGHQCMNCQHEF